MQGGLWLAVLAGKAAIRVCRLLGWGGSTLPGRVARRVHRGVLRGLASQCRRGTVLISGTNGKTTTTAMLSAILSRAGLSLVHNRTGANLVVGLAAAFVEGADLLGRLRADVGLCEVDEASVPAAVRELSPGVALVTNFFRDQLDRYGELAHSVAAVRRGLELLPEGATAVLNADDPLVAGLGRGLNRPVVYFGLEEAGPGTGAGFETADIRHCLQCGAELRYEQVYYAHLGRYSCPGCGLVRPQPQVLARDVQPRGTRGSDLVLVHPGGSLRLKLPLPGRFSVYNALAAASAALSLGVDPGEVVPGLEGFSPWFGRMESIGLSGRRAFFTLVKNPSGFNQVIDMVLGDEEPKPLLIAINDLLADGQDVSWLWDVDFERLAGAAPAIPVVVASGIRAADLAVRLKYAGLGPSRLAVEPDLGRALKLGLERVPPGGTLYVLPTYTAMLGLRRLIHRGGFARPFWEAGRAARARAGDAGAGGGGGRGGGGG
ncbi:MAG: MurT ligase domain-containing protein [Acetobacteraceae bacterium]|nr:MurT ligase domain-containing protein [Acetobacteraceae bacterium]